MMGVRSGASRLSYRAARSRLLGGRCCRQSPRYYRTTAVVEELRGLCWSYGRVGDTCTLATLGRQLPNETGPGRVVLRLTCGRSAGYGMIR